MALSRPKGSKVWVMDFFFHGQRIRESTGMTSITRAKEVQNKRKQDLREGAAGIKPHTKPCLFSTAAKELQETGGVSLSPNSRSEHKDREYEEREKETVKKRQEYLRGILAHLLPFFGRKLLVDIDARDIARYQTNRVEEGAANATVNREVGLLRKLMIQHGLWQRISNKVKMLEESEDKGRALSPAEENSLLLECARSQSNLLLPFVVISLETGARSKTIRRLRWKEINFAKRSVLIGKDKTRGGTDRVVPLSERAMDVLESFAKQYPDRSPDHYLFPSKKERSGAAGVNGSESLTTMDPTSPIGSFNKAWAGAKDRVRRHCQSCKGTLVDRHEPSRGFICIDCGFQVDELPEGISNFRHHDLRHTAVTRMALAGVPLPLIAKIVGWSPRTLAEMILRYTHFTLEQLRSGVATISDTAMFSSVIPLESSREIGPHPINAQKQASPQIGDLLEAHLTPMGKARRDRNGLYEKVWTVPLSKLADEYGVSSSGMCKICKRLRIPVPGRGYWAKRAANLPVKSRPPLKPLLEG